MDNIVKFKLYNYKNIENLNEEGSVILSYSLTDDRVCVKKFVSLKTAEIYKKIKGLEKGLLPEIYDIIDCGQSFLIVEEYIKGLSLERLISDKGPVDEETAKGYIKDILITLEAVHSLNIVHRDISPDNIIIDEAGRARLLDFDIARETGNTARNTDTVILGTAGFASPEQYGFARTDRRSDIYSVGALYNFLLTGTVLQNKIYNREPVSSIIKKAVSIEPEKRYSSCGEMLKNMEFEDFYGGNGEKTKQNVIGRIFSHIPGFRTRKKYKMIIASFVYFILIYTSIYQYSKANSAYVGFWFLYNSFALFVFPMWWFGNRGKNWDMVPFFKKLKPVPKIIAAIAFYIIASAILLSIFPLKSN